MRLRAKEETERERSVAGHERERERGKERDKERWGERATDR